MTRPSQPSAHLLSLDEVAELGHAALGIGGRRCRSRHGLVAALKRRQGPDLEVAGQGPADALIEPVALDRRRNPIAP